MFAGLLGLLSLAAAAATTELAEPLLKIKNKISPFFCSY
jgi:hypothetical protein